MFEAFKKLLTPLPYISIISSTHYYSHPIEYDDNDIETESDSENDSEMET